jgi:hypothetical protein
MMLNPLYTPPTSRNLARLRVLIAGGGVAVLETLLALRALAADRVPTTILAPALKFVIRSTAVDQPFMIQRGEASGWRTPRPSSALAGTVELSAAWSTISIAWSPRMVTSFPMTGSCSPWVPTPSASGGQRECSPITTVATARVPADAASLPTSAARLGEAADVMPEGEHAISVETGSTPLRRTGKAPSASSLTRRPAEG